MKENIKVAMVYIIGVVLFITAVACAVRAIKDSVDNRETPGKQFETNTDVELVFEPIDTAITFEPIETETPYTETETETDSAVVDHIYADENDVLYLAKIIYNEAGLSIYSDEHQLYVGSVVLNRLGRSDFAGDTILELALCGYGDGYPIQYDYSQFGDGAAGFWNIVPDERTIANARFLLENGVIDNSVVWQANFPQGSEVIRKFTYPGAYPATTYICR